MFFGVFFGGRLRSQTGVSGEDAVDVVFRTKQFNVAGGTSVNLATLTESAYLMANESWAVTAP